MREIRGGGAKPVSQVRSGDPELFLLGQRSKGPYGEVRSAAKADIHQLFSQQLTIYRRVGHKDPDPGLSMA